MNKRKLTVYRGCGSYRSPFPQIILQGQWLKSLGFSSGDKITGVCEQDRIIVEKLIEEGKEER